MDQIKELISILYLHLQMPTEKKKICKWPCQEPGQTGWVPELVSTMLLPYVHQPSSSNPDSLVNFVTQYLP